MEYQLLAFPLHTAPDPLGNKTALALCHTHSSRVAISDAVHDADEQLVVVQAASDVGLGGDTLLVAAIGHDELDPGGTMLS